jgi:hypothetical protein
VSVQALQHHPEYAMTLQARKENHTGPDRNAGRTADPTAGRTAVHDPSVSAGFVRNVIPNGSENCVPDGSGISIDNLVITSFQS